MLSLLAATQVAYTFAGDSCDKYARGLRQRSYTTTLNECSCNYKSTCKHMRMLQHSYQPKKLNSTEHMRLWELMCDYYNLDLTCPVDVAYSKVQLSAHFSRFDQAVLINDCVLTLEFKK